MNIDYPKNARFSEQDELNYLSEFKKILNRFNITSFEREIVYDGFCPEIIYRIDAPDKIWGKIVDYMHDYCKCNNLETFMCDSYIIQK